MDVHIDRTGFFNSENPGHVAIEFHLIDSNNKSNVVSHNLLWLSLSHTVHSYVLWVFAFAHDYATNAVFTL